MDSNTPGGHSRDLLYVGALVRAYNAQAIDENATAVYVIGDNGDCLVRDKRVDVIGITLDVAKELGLLLGAEGYSLQVVTECEKRGIELAFYVKTFHHDNYWSATQNEYWEDFCWYDDKGGNSSSGMTGDHNRFHDSIWRLNPEKTIEVMRNVEVPWIAFYVLAVRGI